MTSFDKKLMQKGYSHDVVRDIRQVLKRDHNPIVRGKKIKRVLLKYTVMRPKIMWRDESEDNPLVSQETKEKFKNRTAAKQSFEKRKERYDRYGWEVVSVSIEDI